MYFNIGLIKTGLYSLNKSFNLLNYTTLNGEEIVKRGEKDIDFWLDILNGHGSFKTYLNNTDYISDIPFILFMDEIISELNPTIIMTTRDFDEWYTSIHNYFDIIDDYLRLTQQDEKPIFKLFQMFRNKKINGISLNDAASNKSTAYLFFERYNTSIKKYNPFYIDVNNGWGDLTRLLNIDTPDIDFPHLNKTIDHQQSLSKMKTNTL